MIVYHTTKEGFLSDVRNTSIEDTIRSSVQMKLFRVVEESEYVSWKNSLNYISRVIRSDKIPIDTGIAIEYNIPSTSNRIDFIITGYDANYKDCAILVELKQWSDIYKTEKDGIVKAHYQEGLREVPHPSYQVWSYVTLLNGFNETIQKNRVDLRPCSYLHNLKDKANINDVFYSEYTKKAPVFCHGEEDKLQAFISSYVKYGDKGKVLYEIENGKIRPSKMLADSIVSMSEGKSEFIMIDNQKIVYEESLHLVNVASSGKKQVLIVDGGPGTGKTVIAMNLLIALTSKRLLAHYVTKNSAPRIVYNNKLSGNKTRSCISNLFKGSGSYCYKEKNTMDALIVDEAHRLNERSGMMKNQGENQIKEIINTAKCSIFFIDENQKVSLDDIGSVDEIDKWAKYYNADVHYLTLTSQFRCNGSDGYLNWLDDLLQIRKTANPVLSTKEYDFKIYDNPSEMMDAIIEKNRIANKARVTAGYCWDWNSKNDIHKMDIVMPQFNFAKQWNLGSDGMLWIVGEDSVNQIGCIHTCQGLELDYVGVIVGPDILYRNGKILVDPSKRSKNDRSVFGYKKLMNQNPDGTRDILRSIIKNTYRTLMTRGMKGCYVYFVDQELSNLFKERIIE